jgi:hypothetical protein
MALPRRCIFSGIILSEAELCGSRMTFLIFIDLTDPAIFSGTMALSIRETSNLNCLFWYGYL